jgi:holin-like protein
MIGAFAALLLFQLAGEVIVRSAGLPVPGPVIGMALLVAALATRRGPGEALERVANRLLQHLALLFVPAGTGIMIHAGRLGGEAGAIIAAIVIGTALTLWATAATFVWVSRRMGDAPVGKAS